MDRKLRGFADAEGVLTGVETRSSSPVRILRDETYQSAIRGLFPCGEGAGYAGGIVSAAVWCDLHDCLPPFVSETLELALPVLEQKLPGYAAPDAVLTAVESRSSSPVRIPRDETCQANIRGIYPCGEGAGYAGGILSAAADGMRCAEQIIGGII
jgi:uncharacterized FAD-dependent dehydrogenase